MLAPDVPRPNRAGGSGGEVGEFEAPTNVLIPLLSGRIVMLKDELTAIGLLPTTTGGGGTGR